MRIEGYRADRKAMYEAVKFWKNSPLYREAGLQTEGEQVSLAPWLADTQTEVSESQIATRWAGSRDGAAGSTFEDVAAEASFDDVAEVLSYVAQADEAGDLIEAVVNLLEENDGEVLYIGRITDAEAYALQFNEGRYFMAAMELDTPLLDEGLISMTLLQQTVPDQQAPVVPGFAPIEQKLYEALHAAELIAATINEGDDAADLIESINRFTVDIANVLVEMMADQGSLKDNEAELVLETFLGAYAGIVDEAKKFAA